MANPLIAPQSVAGNPCLLTQFAIDQAFGLDPSSIFQRYGALNALLSDANTRAQGFQILPNRSKPSADNKVISVRYLQYICDASDISTLDKCNIPDGATPDYLTANYYIDDVVIHTWSIDDEDFREMCENPSEVFYKWLAMNYNTFLSKYDTKVLEALVPLMGNYPLGANEGLNSNTDPYPIPLLSSNGNFQPGALALLQGQFDEMGQFGFDPIMVGKGYFGYADKIRAFSGTDQNGVDTNFRGGMANLFIDDLIDKVIPQADGARILSWVPGAIQLLTWNEFTSNYAQYQEIFRGGDFPAEMRRYEYQWTTVNVRPNLEVDFLYNFDKCTGKHTWALRSNFAVVSLPEDSFAQCQDFNYALNFAQTCGDLDCSLITSQTSSESTDE